MSTHPGFHPGMAGPEGEAPTTALGQLPETREKHSTIHEHSPARRRFLMALAGAGGLVLAGGGATVAYFASRNNPSGGPGGSGAGELPAPNNNQISPTESRMPLGDFDIFPKVYRKELTRAELTMPTRAELNRPRAEDAVGAVGQAIQYAVNLDRDKLTDTVSGRFDIAAMQPSHFLLRADYIREHGNAGDSDVTPNHPPILPQDYAWGFHMAPLKVIDDHGFATVVHVEVTMGDYRANNATVAVEPPKKFECYATLVNQENRLLGGQTPNGGWMLYRLDPVEGDDRESPLPPPPDTILNDMPAGYNGVPQLYPLDTN